MNKAYESMKKFWLDVNNLQHKKEVPALGAAQVCIAGVEMAALDDKGQLKHILVAASSLGNASLYFENNSPSGLGGFTGGAASGPVRDKALHMMQAAAKVAEKIGTVDQFPPLQNPENVILFIIDKDGHIRAIEKADQEVRKSENELYAMFAYSQQLIGAFRSMQEQTASAAVQQTSAKDTGTSA